VSARAARLAALLALAACGLRDPAPAAHAWRTVSAARQAHDGDSLRVRLAYGGGTLSVTRTSQPMLYDMRLRYDDEQFEAVRSFNPATSTLTVSVRKRGRGSLLGDRREQGGSLALALAPTVPVSLELDLGAARSDVDLSGLAVRRLDVKSGASETRLRFGTPNATTMDELTVAAGAAGLDIRQLGNANAERARVKGSVADVDLDFSGAWVRDMELSLDVAVGGVTLRIPRALGVRIRLDKVLASFDDDGFVRDDDTYYSASWERSSRRLTIDASTVLGSVDVRWLEH
jgi:hypothetical protein